MEGDGEKERGRERERGEDRERERETEKEKVGNKMKDAKSECNTERKAVKKHQLCTWCCHPDNNSECRGR